MEEYLFLVKKVARLKGIGTIIVFNGYCLIFLFTVVMYRMSVFSCMETLIMNISYLFFLLVAGYYGSTQARIKIPAR